MTTFKNFSKPMTSGFHRIAGIALGVLLIISLGAPPDAAAQRFKPGDRTIAEIAVTNGNFTTLVAALSCTGLVGAVADPEAELTVFAPSDAAFALAGLDATNICSTYDTETLTTILLYHVVGERRPSPSVINGRNKSIEMLAGGSIYPRGQRSLTIDANGSTVNIATPDILASNGIIHVIDFVLLP
jgi:transforming growth factor-beta-induced protein